jgi:hypothetical protein
MTPTQETEDYWKQPLTIIRCCEETCEPKLGGLKFQVSWKVCFVKEGG